MAQLVSLTQTRCFNHPQREAVARCPSCRRHYCRECVTEHDDRLLCASCIAQLAHSDAAPTRRRLPIRPLLELGGAVFLLWMGFYIFGQSLMLIPSEFHDTFDSTVEELRRMGAESEDESMDASPEGQAESTAEAAS